MNQMSIGIVITSNSTNGICKLAALMANDLSSKGFVVTIYMPIIPYYTIFVKIHKKPIYWLTRVAPFYFWKWIFNKKFSFYSMLAPHLIKENKIITKFVIIGASIKQLSKHSNLVINGISDIIYYKTKFPQNRQIYLVNQLEEENQGHSNYFQSIRKSFNGRIVTHCDFMQQELLKHLNNVSIVPNPISYKLWNMINNFDIKKNRKDIILYWKNDTAVKPGIELINKILKKRNKTTVTILARDDFQYNYLNEIKNTYNFNIKMNLQEEELKKLYLSYSFLLFPNIFEDFGMPPVEGLACGCIPILRPNVGAANMYAVNKFNSLFLTGNDNLDTDNIIYLLDNNQALYKMRENSSKKINIFNPEDYGSKILDLQT